MIAHDRIRLTGGLENQIFPLNIPEHGRARAMEFANVYQDPQRAAAYDTLEFPGTYYLAFRDIPDVVHTHVTGSRALDFGCGTGRSTRFLKRLGWDAVGVDIAPEMLELARLRDPQGDYRLSDDGEFASLRDLNFDLIFAAFTFDNIPTLERKARLLRGLRDRLSPGGRIVNLVSSPELYTRDWASFRCTRFPGNVTARSGDFVYVEMLDVDDRRPVQDVLWTDEAYAETYQRAALKILDVRRPLATGDEPIAWVNETAVAPWVVYILGSD